MVDVVVFGAGKLGQAIISAAAQSAAQGDASVRVVAAVDAKLAQDGLPLAVPVYQALPEVQEAFDVIVDSSWAGALDDVLAFALARKTGVVIAATGHSAEQLEAIRRAAEQIPILRSSNLSVGVNVVRRLVEDATRMLGPVDTEIVEAHHRMKVDAPSGTALTLAEAVQEASAEEREIIYGRSPSTRGARGNEIAVHAVRGGTVVGEHAVMFLMEDEIVEIRHVAQSRQVFGFGALKAAAFVASRPAGLYSMEDLLG